MIFSKNCSFSYVKFVLIKSGINEGYIDIVFLIK